MYAKERRRKGRWEEREYMGKERKRQKRREGSLENSQNCKLHYMQGQIHGGGGGGWLKGNEAPLHVNEMRNIHFG